MEQSWFDRVLADQGLRRASFTIEQVEQERPIGFVHLTEINWPCRSAQFGIVIGDSTLHGHGIGTEATRLVIRYSFDTLNLERIELRVAESLSAARHIYEKLGFVEEGKLRRAAYLAGKPIDIVVMGLLRHEFKDEDRPAPASL
jgi:RimJ/RimL family protein N-acetyltransferase